MYIINFFIYIILEVYTFQESLLVRSSQIIIIFFFYVYPDFLD